MCVCIPFAYMLSTCTCFVIHKCQSTKCFMANGKRWLTHRQKKLGNFGSRTFRRLSFHVKMLLTTTVFPRNLATHRIVAAFEISPRSANASESGRPRNLAAPNWTTKLNVADHWKFPHLYSCYLMTYSKPHYPNFGCFAYF